MLFLLLFLRMKHKLHEQVLNIVKTSSKRRMNSILFLLSFLQRKTKKKIRLTRQRAAKNNTHQLVLKSLHQMRMELHQVLMNLRRCYFQPNILKRNLHRTWKEKKLVTATSYLKNLLSRETLVSMKLTLMMMDQ